MKKRFLLIAGHGAGDPGACATFGSVTYKESEEAIKVVDGIAAALTGYDCEVAVYPHSRNAYADYLEGKLRSNAKFQNYNYALEIHFNAFTRSEKDGRVKGSEIYYPSAGQASGCEDKILAALAAIGLTTRKSAAGKFAVINTAAADGCRANLLEVCFLDDADDLQIYTKNRTEICQAIAQAVCESLGIKTKEKEGTEMTEEAIRRIVREEIAAVEKEQRMKNPAAWSKSDREWAEKNGIIKGTGNGMEYQAPCTREQMVAFLHRYDAVKGGA